MPTTLATTYIEITLRLAFAVLAIWTILVWLKMTLNTTSEQSDRVVRVAGPDVTPFEMLPNAAQRIGALNDWAAAQAAQVRWVWDAQIARMVGLSAVLAALAAWAAGTWPVWMWGALGLAALAPRYKIRQLRDQRAQALEALASRRDELIRKTVLT